jgi:phosphatidylglycerol:prolipoprotein diacylglycerol transferase
MIAAAAVVFLIVAVYEFRRAHYDWKHLIIMASWAVVGALAFCNLVYIVTHWEAFIANPGSVLGKFTWNLPWIMAGAVLALLLITRINRLSFWKVADIVAIATFPTFAVQRIGCIINGCCHGLPAVLPWSVAYINAGSLAPIGVPIHPTQFYYLLWNVAVYFALKMLQPRVKTEGIIFLIGLALYGVGDLIIRFYRDESPVFLGLQMGQLISIVLLMVSVPWVITKMARDRHRQNPAT